MRRISQVHRGEHRDTLHALDAASLAILPLKARVLLLRMTQPFSEVLMQAHVLSVGQCSFDDSRLARVLAVEADAHMDRAHSAEDARQKIAATPYDLVLVNRVIDGDGASGVDFIAELRKVDGAPCAMLISDYPDAQAAAVANGAVAGFGKSSLGSAEVGQRLRQALHSCGRAGLQEKLAAAKGQSV
jgi:hypothetical protein